MVPPAKGLVVLVGLKLIVRRSCHRCSLDWNPTPAEMPFWIKTVSTALLPHSLSTVINQRELRWGSSLSWKFRA